MTKQACERAYKNAANWSEVAFEDAVISDNDDFFDIETQIEGMSTRYIPIALPDISHEHRMLSATVKVGHSIHVSAYLLSDGLVSDSITLVPNENRRDPSSNK